MSENYNSVREQVNHYLKVFKRKEDFDSINSHDTYKILVISFMVTMNLFNISYDLEKFLPLIKKFVLSSSEHNFDYSQNIVNEFADGGDLAQKIEQQKNVPFPESQILDYITQICLALQHIHKKKYFTEI